MEKKKQTYYRYENQSDGKNNFKLKENYLTGAWKNCFLSKEDATKHFEKSYKIAQEKHEKTILSIEKLREELGSFYFDYYLKGDTYGIYDEGMYIGIEVNGYDFEFPL